MGAESSLRRRHRVAVQARYPDAMIVSQPASAFTGKGRTDFYVVVSGRYVGLELKTSEGRPSTVQLARIARIRRAGGWADVVRSPAESLALIAYALQGGTMWKDLFDSEEEPEPKEIRAFSEPNIEAEVRSNGMNPSGDGVMQEPPADYPFAAIIQRLDEVSMTLAKVAHNLLTIMREIGIDPTANPGPMPKASQAPPSEEAPAAPPAPPRRSRRKA